MTYENMPIGHYVLDRYAFTLTKQINEYYKGNLDNLSFVNSNCFKINILLDEKLNELVDLFDNSIGDNYPFDGGELYYLKELLAIAEDSGDIEFFLIEKEI